MAITPTPFRPNARPVSTVGQAPLPSQGPAPVRAPRRKSPQINQADMITPPAENAGIKTRQLVQALAGFGSSLNAVATMVDRNNKIKVNEYATEYNRELVGEGEEDLTASYQDLAAQAEGNRNKMRALDKLYGNRLGMIRSSKAIAQVQNAGYDPRSVLDSLKKNYAADTSTYGSDSFKKAYAESLTRAEQYLFGQVAVFESKEIRQESLNALKETMLLVADQYEASPEMVLSDLDDTLQFAEGAYIGEDTDLQITPEEFNEVYLQVADILGQRGNKELSDFLLDRMRGKKGDLPPLSRVADKATADRVATIRNRSSAVQSERLKERKPAFINELNLAAVDGTADAKARAAGFKGGLEDSELAAFVGADTLKTIRAANEKGERFAFRQRHEPLADEIRQMATQGTAREHPTHPLSLSSPFLLDLFGKEELTSLVNRNADAQVTKSEIGLAAAHRAEGGALFDRHVSDLVMQITTEIQRDPSNIPSWFAITNVSFDTNIQGRSGHDYTRNKIQEEVMKRLFERIEKASPSSEAELASKARIMGATGWQDPNAKAAMTHGIDALDIKASTRPEEIPEVSVAALNWYRAFSSMGYDSVAREIAGDREGGYLAMAHHLTQTLTGSDLKGSQEALIIVGGWKDKARNETPVARSNRLAQADVKQSAKDATDQLQGFFDDDILNSGVLNKEFETNMSNFIALGAPTEQARDMAVKVTGVTFSNVNGIAMRTADMPMDVAGMTKVADFLVQNYKDAYPEDEGYIDDDDKIVLMQQQRGVWYLGYASTGMPVENDQSIVEFDLGDGAVRQQPIGRFSKQDLLSLTRASRQRVITDAEELDQRRRAPRDAAILPPVGVVPLY